MPRADNFDYLEYQDIIRVRIREASERLEGYLLEATRGYDRMVSLHEQVPFSQKIKSMIYDYKQIISRVNGMLGHGTTMTNLYDKYARITARIERMRSRLENTRSIRARRDRIIVGIERAGKKYWDKTKHDYFFVRLNRLFERARRLAEFPDKYVPTRREVFVRKGILRELAKKERTRMMVIVQRFLRDLMRDIKADIIELLEGYYTGKGAEYAQYGAMNYTHGSLSDSYIEKRRKTAGIKMYPDGHDYLGDLIRCFSRDFGTAYGQIFRVSTVKERGQVTGYEITIGTKLPMRWLTPRVRQYAHAIEEGSSRGGGRGQPARPFFSPVIKKHQHLLQERLDRYIQRNLPRDTYRPPGRR